MMGPRLRATLVLLIVFVLGVFAGIVIARHHLTPTAPMMSVAEEHQAALEELRADVGLDDDQIEQVHAIVAKHHGVVQRSWEQLRPEVQDAMRQVHVEIGEILRDDQIERFHDWLMKRREQHLRQRSMHFREEQENR